MPLKGMPIKAHSSKQSTLYTNYSELSSIFFCSNVINSFFSKPGLIGGDITTLQIPGFFAMVCLGQNLPMFNPTGSTWQAPSSYRVHIPGLILVFSPYKVLVPSGNITIDFFSPMIFSPAFFIFRIALIEDFLSMKIISNNFHERPRTGTKNKESFKTNLASLRREYKIIGSNIDWCLEAIITGSFRCSNPEISTCKPQISSTSLIKVFDHMWLIAKSNFLFWIKIEKVTAGAHNIVKMPIRK
jgi:hypothetical protein